MTVGISILVQGFEKCDYYLNRKKSNYQINSILWNIKRDCAECLKNAINLLVPSMYKMNF